MSNPKSLAKKKRENQLTIDSWVKWRSKPSKEQIADLKKFHRENDLPCPWCAGFKTLNVCLNCGRIMSKE